MREKISSFQYHWQIVALTILVNYLVLISKFSRPRSLIHWVGYHKRRRPEKALRLVIVAMISYAFMTVNTDEYIYWFVIYGGTIAILLNLYVVYHFTPQKAERS
jgi:hypothetical protein